MRLSLKWSVAFSNSFAVKSLVFPNVSSLVFCCKRRCLKRFSLRFCFLLFPNNLPTQKHKREVEQVPMPSPDLCAEIYSSQQIKRKLMMLSIFKSFFFGSLYVQDDITSTQEYWRNWLNLGFGIIFTYQNNFDHFVGRYATLAYFPSITIIPIWTRAVDRPSSVAASRMCFAWIKGTISAFINICGKSNTKIYHNFFNLQFSSLMIKLYFNTVWN